MVRSTFLVILGAAFFSAASSPSLAATETPSSASPQTVISEPIQPALALKASDVMRDLYGVIGAREQYVLKASDVFMPADGWNEFLASIWFTHAFEHQGAEHQVAFVQLQAIDPETRDVAQTRATPVFVAAMTYKKTAAGWAVAGRQAKPFTDQIGGWGRAPEVDRPETLQLNENVTVLMVDASSSGQGWTYEGRQLLAFDGDGWAYRGYLTVGLNNYNNLCWDGINDEFKDRDPCFEDKGTITIIPSHGKMYPDILVVMTGENQHYTFKDGEYVSTTKN